MTSTTTITIAIASDQRQSIASLCHLATALGAQSFDVVVAAAASDWAAATLVGTAAAPPSVAVAAAPPSVVFATRAAAQASLASPPAAAAGAGLAPADMRVAYVGPTVRSPAVDALQAAFRALPADSPRSLVAEVLPLARPDSKSHKAIVTKGEALCLWVTGAKHCSSLAWTDDEERVGSFFTTKIGSHSDGSKRQYADALRALYLSYDQRNAARQDKYWVAYRTYQQRELAPNHGGGQPTAHELANTPTMAEIEQAKAEADPQGRAFVALGTAVQARCQNYEITPMYRRLDGALLFCHDLAAVPGVNDASGWPTRENAYIIPEDASAAPVYVQNHYKTKARYGQKVAPISPDVHEHVMRWLEVSPNKRALFLDTTNAPVHNGGADAGGDTVAGLCRRIFSGVCGKAVTPGLIRRACANTKEMRAAISFVMEGADLRNHSLLMEMTSGHYAFKGPASN
jgi:hypothetical protein